MRAFLLVVFILMGPLLLFGQSDQNRVNEAITLQGQGEYPKSLEIYNEILTEGFQSEYLYLNASKAAYDMGALPKARLYIEQGLKVYPKNAELKYNQRVLIEELDSNLRIVDDFFLLRIWKTIYLCFSASGWAIIMILGLVALIGLVAAQWFKKGLVPDKIHNYAKWVFGFIIILSFVSAGFKYQQETQVEAAIVMQSTDLKDGPDNRSESKVELRAGEKVEILDSIGVWCKVSLSNKQLGWLSKEVLTEI